MTMNLPWDNEVDLRTTLPRDNKSSCECEVKLASGQSLPRGSSLSWFHVNRPKTYVKGYLQQKSLLFRAATSKAFKNLKNCKRATSYL